MFTLPYGLGKVKKKTKKPSLLRWFLRKLIEFPLPLPGSNRELFEFPRHRRLTAELLKELFEFLD